MTRRNAWPRSARRLATLLAVLTCCGPAVALAGPSGLATPAATHTQLSDAELSGIRGGFMVEGITFGFGAQVRTYVDGALALQTDLTWTDKGAVTHQISGGVGSPIGEGAGRPGLNLTGLQGADGVVLDGPGGATAIAQRITAGQIENLVVNTANNRNIRQDIQLNLVLPDLARMQSGFAMQQATMRMNSSLSDSAMNALRH